jgi:hypothetical protein
MAALTHDLASKFAGLALNHVRREFPNKLDHVMNDAGDVRTPRELHPVFYGSFDWHSCVHGYWLLARVWRRFPELAAASHIRVLFDGQLTEGAIAQEIAYLRSPNRATFERPYGWGWLLMLAAELKRFDSEDGKRWSVALQPLADEVVVRFHNFLPKATYPIRAGTHFNTAFGCVLALEYAVTAGDDSLAALVRSKVVEWYGGDVDCQAWEPGGDDFLSSALIEAECMRRALPAHEFVEWFGTFLPRVSSREPATLFAPAIVSDRSDGKIAHLDGLNLSRAWCWTSLARSLPQGDPRADIAMEAAFVHLEASLPHVAGDYSGEHWLATFALLALEAQQASD